nr:MAG TPA: hypothetical protein [Bacteriophage sp.]
MAAGYETRQPPFKTAYVSRVLLLDFLAACCFKW